MTASNRLHVVLSQHLLNSLVDLMLPLIQEIGCHVSHYDKKMKSVQSSLVLKSCAQVIYSVRKVANHCVWRLNSVCLHDLSKASDKMNHFDCMLS